jgi:hypothetical protein
MRRNLLFILTVLPLATLHAANAPAPGTFVSILDFGAATNKTDNTEAIQQAVNTGRTALVPPGDFAVNGTVVIASNQRLHLSHGAWLKRLADRTDNTAPLVRLTGNGASLTGEGLACGVSTENASGGRTGDEIINNGVVNVGPPSAKKYTNINFWTIDSLVIAGSAKAWNDYQKPPHPDDVDRNELLTLVNGAKLSAGRGSCYNGRVSNCLFRQGGIGIKLNPVCNGNLFSNNFFYKISHSCFFAEHVTENLFQGCFVHFSAGVTVIHLQKCGYNHFYGVMCEPGPNGPKKRPSRYCNISEDSFQNVLIGHGNTGHAYINKSASSLIVTHGRLMEGVAKPSAAARAAPQKQEK